MVVRRIVDELVVRDRELQPVAEDLQLRDAHLLGLVRDVPRLDRRAERPPLDGLREHRGRRAGVPHRGVVRRVHLAVVVAAATQSAQLLVAEVLDELAEPRIRSEEMLPDVLAGFDGVTLELTVERRVHLVDEHAVRVAGEQFVPFPSPHDLQHVPAGAAEDRFELLDDLAVPPDGTVQALQVAVDDEDQVVQLLA